jgi:hypothetical protein
VEESLSVGILASNTVGAPTTHGAGITGVQGIGVSTPKAAEVALATAGFAKDIQVPNGKTFKKATLSMMLAAGMEQAFTKFAGSTVKVEGAAPKEQLIMAPLQT